mmetsp:Transcript_25425/g.31328  ORF Transcript_25425/g.31328 Transcript_25425/m.31328 type:complete len:382 (+) Transcript_25425:119-1264(+)
MSDIFSWRDAIYYRTSCQEPDHEDERSHENNNFGNRPSITKLPTLASNVYETKEYQIDDMLFGWTTNLKVLLEGVHDNNSSLHVLNGLENTIIRRIVAFASDYAKHVKLTLPAKLVGSLGKNQLIKFVSRENASYVMAQDLTSSSGDYVSCAVCGKINFPPPHDHNVNMMPFILGNKNSLPSYLQQYFDCIAECPISKKEYGKVCYLTVHESFVHGGIAQRREGLHIETPGIVISSEESVSFTPGLEHSWGGGHFFQPDVYEGGIYFASNMTNTSVVYDALVDKSVPGIVDKHGGCEHLRKFIGPGMKLEAGQLVWMTDRTPHEALPQEQDGYRQFFRVVTSQISHWFAEHSSPNSKVPLPDNVIVVHENKFDETLVNNLV